ncbi:superoxide dismutase family protein [Kushneria phosphatilytica]|uniref:Superoxide dismutase [Cu-Zn] n=1 Tax=Kushneria phosphatilytica TaxID=657387 RepID=A0A1S1NUE3_9GAMM|nr:superoxide dismutase family protein [Kushneria phosphatilytica]OHV09329.1 superoxide dismutase [Kushneria phosphatilytica]QEL12292.1 superoxide dismutase family protein [Kushneria phosphatilytica]
MRRWLMSLALLGCAAPALADVTVEMHRLDAQGIGESIGTVTFEESRYGLLIQPALHDLPAGTLHGFHLHQNPDCGPATHNGKTTPGGAAGGHFDPGGTDTHAGPYVEQSHLGDMPVLMIGPQGKATTPMLAPRLKESDLMGHAVIVHEGGDTYDEPPKLGGGGARLACGVINGSA